MITLNQKQLDLIHELLECQNCVEAGEYNEQDHAEMEYMRLAGLVRLSWSVTEAGKKASHLKLS